MVDSIYTCILGPYWVQEGYKGPTMQFMAEWGGTAKVGQAGTRESGTFWLVDAQNNKQQRAAWYVQGHTQAW